MADEVYAVLAGKYGGVTWSCSSCLASTARIEASLKQLETRVAGVEENLAAVESRAKNTETRMDKVEMLADQTRKLVTDSTKDTASVIFEELREREEKKLNVVIHCADEAPTGTFEEQRMWEESAFNSLMEVIEVDITFKENVKFSRRLGRRMENKPRPLLVGFKVEKDRETVLDSARKLMRTNLRMINIVPDLTKRQRDTEEELRKEADRRNATELSEDDRSKNVRWVVVGRKGARKLLKREVRDFSQTASNHPRQVESTQLSRKRTYDQQESTAGKRQRGEAGVGVGAENEQEEDVFVSPRA